MSNIIEIKTHRKPKIKGMMYARDESVGFLADDIKTGIELAEMGRRDEALSTVLSVFERLPMRNKYIQDVIDQLDEDGRIQRYRETLS